jgi:hypothetical protein
MPFYTVTCVSTRVQGTGQLLPAAGPGGRAEAPQDGTVTAAPRYSGDGGDGTAGSAAPSRAAPLQEEKIWLFCAGQNQQFQSHHVLVSWRLRSDSTDCHAGTSSSSLTMCWQAGDYGVTRWTATPEPAVPVSPCAGKLEITE